MDCHVAIRHLVLTSHVIVLAVSVMSIRKRSTIQNGCHEYKHFFAKNSFISMVQLSFRCLVYFFVF